MRASLNVRNGSKGFFSLGGGGGRIGGQPALLGRSLSFSAGVMLPPAEPLTTQREGGNVLLWGVNDDRLDLSS